MEKLRKDFVSIKHTSDIIITLNNYRYIIINNKKNCFTVQFLVEYFIYLLHTHGKSCNVLILALLAKCIDKIVSPWLAKRRFTLADFGCLLSQRGRNKVRYLRQCLDTVHLSQLVLYSLLSCFRFISCLYVFLYANQGPLEGIK